MKIGMPLAIIIAAVTWFVLYVIIGVALWIAFVVGGGILAAGVAAGAGAQKVGSSGRRGGPTPA
jgi:hypothetical protein